MEPTRHNVEVRGRTTAPGFGQIDEFDRELEALHEEITQIERDLAPILRSLDENEAEKRMIEEAPAHDLHARILRLGQLNNQLRFLHGRVVL